MQDGERVANYSSLGRAVYHTTVAEQQAHCYKLRRTGMTLQKIADETGLGMGTVHKRIQAAIAAAEQQQQQQPLRGGGDSA
jgi:DNA-directed RNA polymerase specialized sigma24 family protein